MMESTEIKNLSEDFERTRQHIEALLRKSHTAEAVVSETTLIFEALCHSIFAQQENAVIRVSGAERLGYVLIRLGFEGRMYIPESDEDGELSPEGMVLRAYADKLDCSYHSGYNRILITVRRGSLASLLPCIIGMLAAIAVVLPIRLLSDARASALLLNNLVFPLEELFTNAVLMVCAPVTFLSFLKNMTDTYIIAERSSDTRRLNRDVIKSSVLSVLLAIGFALVVAHVTQNHRPTVVFGISRQIDMTLPEWITSLIPSDIFTPFQTVSPFPLFIVAAIVTYALCSSGKYFDKVKDAIDTGYALFSRMLGIVMYALPFFVFAATLDLLLGSGFGVLLYLLGLVLTVLLGLTFLIAYYVIRLRRAGEPVIPFVKLLVPQLCENWKIGSAIDAVPFNIRYCILHHHMDRRRIENALPVLAQINLDGNCFIITLTALILMLTGQADVTAQGVAAVAILVLFLSLGAPNQPGSCLIGMVILLTYMDAHELIPIAIFCEMFFGGLQNLINVTGDLVTLTGLKKTEQTGSAL